jgi:hypothetical protein
LQKEIKKIIKEPAPKKGVVYMTVSFPIISPGGKSLVDILTKTCPSTIIFARSDMLLPLRGAPVKSAAVRLPLATVPFIGALISPSLVAL